MTAQPFYRPFLNRDRLVHILDADAGSCEALSVLFRLEGFQTAFTMDTASFFAAVGRRRPDVVILGHAAGKVDGISVLRRLKAMQVGSPVFMIEDEAQVSTAVKAMKAGAVDVVTRPLDAEYLLGAVRQTLRRDVNVSAVDDGTRSIEVHGFAQLTPREREVLQLITNGQSNKEAGRLLGISPRTIEVHRARVMEKLGARNTADLMRIVLTS